MCAFNANGGVVGGGSFTKEEVIRIDILVLEVIQIEIGIPRCQGQRLV
jgi:hypothetical protein